MWPWLGDAVATDQRRNDLWRLLGPRPWRAAGVAGERLSGEERGHAAIEHWRLHLNAEQPAPALLLRPRGATPRGVVLYCHAHGNRFETGKDELLVGRPALQSPPYGEVLAARGWAVLAIDHWGFGERRHVSPQGPGSPGPAPRGGARKLGAARRFQPSERALVKRLLWQGATLWGWRVHDTLAALDWLRTQPGFESLPVVTLGLSMGSTMALWSAALDTRIAGCVELCCAAEYAELLSSGGFDLHGEYFFVPGLLNTFTLAEIAALIAPRPHLSLAGRADPLTPPSGLAMLDRTLRAADAAMGTRARWQQVLADGGHAETAEMRSRVLAWLDATSPASTL